MSGDAAGDVAVSTRVEAIKSALEDKHRLSCERAYTASGEIDIDAHDTLSCCCCCCIQSSERPIEETECSLFNNNDNDNNSGHPPL